MCGIAGFWIRSLKKINRHDLKRMLTAIEHRGPDDHGIYENIEHGIYLGHRRLSILDLSEAGRQPMVSDNGDIVLTYNGEVYNFREIRQELESYGYRFRSLSDTEVILKSYEKWGLNAIHRFRGMFAFVIWDRRKSKVYLVRDRAGVKPLYYTLQNGNLIFASEPKAILASETFTKKLDNSALIHYLQFGYISPPMTAYEEMLSVRPGHYVEISAKGNIKEIKYWDILAAYQDGVELQRTGHWNSRKEDDVVEELEDIMTRAFKYRMISDVPVGLFLSGGIDSSIVAAILAKRSNYDLNTFTIGTYDKTFNEATYAKTIAESLGTNHTELYYSPQMNLEMIEDIPNIFDEPFGDNSVIPTYLVSKLARQEVKVSLSGDGGDELFCGYPRFNIVNNYCKYMERTPRIIQFFTRNIFDLLPVSVIDSSYRIVKIGQKRRAAFKDKIIKVKQMISNQSQPEVYEAAISYWYKDQLSSILKTKNKGKLSSNDIIKVFNAMGTSSVMDKMMCLDFKKYMVDDVLVKVDRASMAVSLEAREPLLDHELIEFSAKLPLHYKYRNGVNKYILKKILYKYLPKSMFQRPKQGFAVPVDAWLRGPLKPLVYKYLNTDVLKDDEIFDSTAVNNAVRSFYKGGGISAINIWYLLEFQMWKQRWMN